jgi:hypothetical protein
MEALAVVNAVVGFFLMVATFCYVYLTHRLLMVDKKPCVLVLPIPRGFSVVNLSRSPVYLADIRVDGFSMEMDLPSIKPGSEANVRWPNIWPRLVLPKMMQVEVRYYFGPTGNQLHRVVDAVEMRDSGSSESEDESYIK